MTPVLSYPDANLLGMDDDSLTDLEREVLIFERSWWRYAGAKETEIRKRFEMSSHRYYQFVNSLIDRPAALVFDPSLVKRLRRLRTTRQQRRSGRAVRA